MAWPTLTTWEPERLRDDRVQRGLSRHQLAGALDVSVPAIKAWELGQKHPGPLAYKTVTDFFRRDRWFYAPVDPSQRTLTDYRLRSGLRLIDLKRELNIHHNRVYAVESGLVSLNDAQIASWCRALNMSESQWHQARMNAQEVKMSA